MDSVTRGSGIAVSVLVAATATIVLLLPGKPAGSWPGPGHARPGRHILGRGDLNLGSAWTWIAALRPRPGLADQPAAGPRPGCRAWRARRPGRGQPRPASGPAGPGPRAARPRSCRPSRAHRHQQPSRRLSRYRGIRPDLP